MDLHPPLFRLLRLRAARLCGGGARRLCGGGARRHLCAADAAPRYYSTILAVSQQMGVFFFKPIIKPNSYGVPELRG